MPSGILIEPAFAIFRFLSQSNAIVISRDEPASFILLAAVCRSPAGTVGPVPAREGPITQEEARPWKEFFRVLFDQNVAAISLTDVDGRLVDCNEKCARIFGFESGTEMLAHSAWDFYFDRAEREVLVDRLRSQGSCPAEEFCYRDRNGRPIRLLAACSLVSSADGRPDLILSTAIEAAPQRDVRLVGPEPSAVTDERQVLERDRMADVSRKLTSLLERAAQILHEDNLPTLGKAQIREALYVLEEIKMLMPELEILRLPPM